VCSREERGSDDGSKMKEVEGEGGSESGERDKKKRESTTPLFNGSVERGERAETGVGTHLQRQNATTSDPTLPQNHTFTMGRVVESRTGEWLVWLVWGQFTVSKPGEQERGSSRSYATSQRLHACCIIPLERAAGPGSSLAGLELLLRVASRNQKGNVVAIEQDLLQPRRSLPFGGDFILCHVV